MSDEFRFPYGYAYIVIIRNTHTYYYINKRNSYITKELFTLFFFVVFIIIRYTNLKISLSLSFFVRSVTKYYFCSAIQNELRGRASCNVPCSCSWGHDFLGNEKIKCAPTIVI